MLSKRDEIQAKNIEIEAQRDLALEQKDFIEKQNHAITNSINYARRIQQALLPELSILTNPDNSLDSLDDCFVVFKPKEIVSGDFYWANRVSKYIVVADCTGHGVPGSFMSMLGISFLNEIVNKQENLVANQILNQLRDSVSDTLSQAGKNDQIDDVTVLGFRVCLVCIISFQSLNFSKRFFSNIYITLCYLLKLVVTKNTISKKTSINPNFGDTVEIFCCGSKLETL